MEELKDRVVENSAADSAPVVPVVADGEDGAHTKKNFQPLKGCSPGEEEAALCRTSFQIQIPEVQVECVLRAGDELSIHSGRSAD